jgi:hypothetical protein
MQLKHTLGMFKAEKCKLCQSSIYLAPLRSQHNWRQSPYVIFYKNWSLSNHMCQQLYTTLLCPMFSAFQLIGLNQRMNQSGVNTPYHVTSKGPNQAWIQQVSQYASTEQLHNFRRWTNQVWAQSLWSNQNESSSHVTPHCQVNYVVSSMLSCD